MGARVATKVLYRQVGWMKCVACSDSKRLPGKMWLGYTKIGDDNFMPCPECKGTAEVPRYQVLDAMTGEEIDYEAFGRTPADAPDHLQE